MVAMFDESSAMDAHADALDLLLGIVESQYLARNARPSAAMAIPVIVIAGFLGAGKTTLLRHVLTSRHGKKIAAVVNDFAALNIDANLVKEASADTVALENGCVCCSLSGSVARTLLAIAERDQRPDAIIIEASGVADPANIAQIAAAVPGLMLDNVVSVADATLDLTQPEFASLLFRQMAVADIVLLNKTDMVSRNEITLKIEAIKAIAPKAVIIQTSYSAVPLSLLIDGVHELAHHPDDTYDNEEPDFESMSIPADAPFERLAFEKCLSLLPPSVLRVKGFVRFSEDPGESWLVQCVRRRWNLQRCDTPPHQHGLVVIGLSHAWNAETIRSCFENSGKRCATGGGEAK